MILTLLAAPMNLIAQYQKKPPDFGGTHSFPTPVHPEPVADWLRSLDVVFLAVALGVAAWLAYKRRSRRGIALLSLASVAYFGFYRKGCICSVGSIQNIVLCLTDSRYFVSFSILALFFLPLVVTLFFGRVFCSGVCPLGAIQDLVLVKPLRVPLRLDRALRYLQFVYLGLAVLFAGWGLQLHLGSWQLKINQRFIICDWDPFISIFRRTGPFHMVAIGVAFLLAGMFIGRPYCRWLCPYGGILAILSRISWNNIRISPDKELDCGLCAEACPFGAIRELRADRAFCLACARCYEFCPQHKKFIALRDGPSRTVQITNSASAVGGDRPNMDGHPGFFDYAGLCDRAAWNLYPCAAGVPVKIRRTLLYCAKRRPRTRRYKRFCSRNWIGSTRLRLPGAAFMILAERRCCFLPRSGSPG